MCQRMMISRRKAEEFREYNSITSNHYTYDLDDHSDEDFRIVLRIERIYYGRSNQRVDIGREVRLTPTMIKVIGVVLTSEMNNPAINISITNEDLELIDLKVAKNSEVYLRIRFSGTSGEKIMGTMKLSKRPFNITFEVKLIEKLEKSGKFAIFKRRRTTTMVFDHFATQFIPKPATYDYLRLVGEPKWIKKDRLENVSLTIDSLSQTDNDNDSKCNTCNGNLNSSLTPDTSRNQVAECAAPSRSKRSAANSPSTSKQCKKETTFSLPRTEQSDSEPDGQRLLVKNTNQDTSECMVVYDKSDANRDVIIKVTLDDDTRKMSVKDCITFEALKANVFETFAVKLTSRDSFVLKYKDEDGDVITIGNDSDLKLALKTSPLLRVLNEWRSY